VHKSRHLRETELTLSKITPVHPGFPDPVEVQPALRQLLCIVAGWSQRVKAFCRYGAKYGQGCTAIFDGNSRLIQSEL